MRYPCTSTVGKASGNIQVTSPRHLYPSSSACIQHSPAVVVAEQASIIPQSRCSSAWLMTQLGVDGDDEQDEEDDDSDQEADW